MLSPNTGEPLLGCLFLVHLILCYSLNVMFLLDVCWANLPFLLNFRNQEIELIEFLVAVFPLLILKRVSTLATKTYINSFVLVDLFGLFSSKSASGKLFSFIEDSIDEKLSDFADLFPKNCFSQFVFLPNRNVAETKKPETRAGS